MSNQEPITISASTTNQATPAVHSSHTTPAIDSEVAEVLTPTGISVTAISGLLLVLFGKKFVESFFREEPPQTELQVIKDKAEKDIILVLQEDNLALRREMEDFWKKCEHIADERNEAVSQMGKILAELDSSRVKILELQNVVDSLSSKLDEQTKLLQSILGENIKLKLNIENLECLNNKLEREIVNIESLVGKSSTNVLK
jgi:hypothetical protein